MIRLDKILTKVDFEKRVVKGKIPEGFNVSAVRQEIETKVLNPQGYYIGESTFTGCEFTFSIYRRYQNA